MPSARMKARIGLKVGARVHKSGYKNSINFCPVPVLQFLNKYWYEDKQELTSTLLCSKFSVNIRGLEGI